MKFTGNIMKDIENFYKKEKTDIRISKINNLLIKNNIRKGSYKITNNSNIYIINYIPKLKDKIFEVINNNFKIIKVTNNCIHFY